VESAVCITITSEDDARDCHRGTFYFKKIIEVHATSRGGAWIDTFWKNT